MHDKGCFRSAKRLRAESILPPTLEASRGFGNDAQNGKPNGKDGERKEGFSFTCAIQQLGDEYILKR